jgi:3-oxoacyl-[acyl-carrier-protein] synthase-1
VFFGDQAGIVPVLAAAHQLLASNSVGACLVGGVDSLVEPRWLGACEELGLLKTPVRPVGLIPGDAAAFLLLEKHSRSGGRRPPLGLVTACASGHETSHRFSDNRPVERTLADVIRKCLPPDGSAAEAAIICDLNGDTVRAFDLGNALVQVHGELRSPETVVPAISFGDTRAASGFVGACMALRAFARGYAPSRSFVVSASGDDGTRGAFLITTPN